MRFRTFVALTACGVGVSLTNLAFAQQSPQTNQTQQANQTQQGQRVQQGQQGQGQARNGQIGQQTIWQNNDQLLANCVAIENQKEIAIAKDAQEKAKSKDAKDFAQMLVKDHQAFLQKLQRYAPETTREGYLNASDHPNVTNRGEDQSTSKVQSAGGEVRNAAGQIQQTAGARNDSAQPINILQLHREVAEECIRNAKQMMEKKDGKEFDECFIGFQIAAHAAMKDKLTVFQRHVSGELRPILADGLQTTEKHLKKAEDLMKDLAGDSKNRESAANSK